MKNFELRDINGRTYLKFIEENDGLKSLKSPLNKIKETIAFTIIGVKQKTSAR
jgi:hypothetical protein